MKHFTGVTAVNTSMIDSKVQPIEVRVHRLALQEANSVIS